MQTKKRRPWAVEGAKECLRAEEIGLNSEQQKWELADLLTAIKQKELWRTTNARNFREFVVERVRISMRMAQELIRLRAKCDELGIPREKIDELGWSKFATIVTSLNEDNKDEVLGDVKNLSLGDLREKYRAKARAIAVKPESHVTVTEAIKKAVGQAACHTQSDDFQANLEFVCSRFVELVPSAPPRISDQSEVHNSPLFVDVPATKNPIQKSPGFAKKGLSKFKIDLDKLCQAGCPYCSSNHGYALRINQQFYADLTEQQLGRRVLPTDEPRLTFRMPEILPNLEKQLACHPGNWGHGETLMFSMLTDGFSPHLFKSGTSERALRMILERTAFRIRVLTKIAIVGSPKWVEFFREYAGRFVIGLSIGTLDDDWARRIEKGTSTPTARIAALRKLQDAGIPTFGMLCPVFPHALQGDQVERLIASIRPELLEDVWVEPYNDRKNWREVHRQLLPTDFDFAWLDQTYAGKQPAQWSRYATELYRRLKQRADAGGWTDKLRYLLYERGITKGDAASFAGLRGVMLQGKVGEDGRSKNPHIAALQAPGA